MSTSPIQKKICLIGEFGVGKTSLIERFVFNSFSEKYISTLGVRVSQKLLPPLPDRQGIEKQLNLLIWDIEGAGTNPSRLARNYYQGAAGAILVTDVMRLDNVEAPQQVLQMFKEVAPSAKVVVAVNKIDLVPDLPDEASLPMLQWARELSLPSLLTSAKTGENVEALFLKLARLLLHED